MKLLYFLSFSTLIYAIPRDEHDGRGMYVKNNFPKLFILEIITVELRLLAHLCGRLKPTLPASLTTEVGAKRR